MTIIITKFNYAYETKKTSYRYGERKELPSLDGDGSIDEKDEEEVENTFWFGDQRYSIVSCPS